MVVRVKVDRRRKHKLFKSNPAQAATALSRRARYLCDRQHAAQCARQVSQGGRQRPSDHQALVDRPLGPYVAAEGTDAGWPFTNGQCCRRGTDAS